MKVVLKSFACVLLVALPACSRPAPATGPHATEASGPAARPSPTAAAEAEDGVSDVAADANPAPPASPLTADVLEGGRWVPIATEGAPSPREGAGAVFVGDELVVWGGDDPVREAQFGRHRRPSRTPLRGGVYDTRTRTWRTMSTEGQPAAGRTQVWPPKLYVLSGRRVVVCVPVGDCRLYDLAADTWTQMARFPTVEPDCVVTAQGSELVCVELQVREGAFVASRYDFVGGRWRQIGSTYPSHGYLSRPSATGATVFTGAVTNGFRFATIDLPSPAYPDGRIVDGGIEVFGPRLVSALREVRPATTRSVFFFHDFDQVCQRAAEPHCRRIYDVTHFSGGRERCHRVEALGPSIGGPFAVRPQLDDCEPLPGEDGFLCFGERVMYHNGSDRMLAYESHGFGCVAQGEDLYCWAATPQGQPSLRHASAQAYDSGRVAMWGGRATEIEEPVRDLRRGNCIRVDPPGTPRSDPEYRQPRFCGMRRNGPLLNDGAIYEVGRGPRLQTSPCPLPATDVDGDDDNWDGDDEVDGSDIDFE